MTTIKKYPFKKGYAQLTREGANAVKLDVMDAFGISSNQFYIRMRGEVEPKVSEAATIERIFHKRGVTNIWGE